MANGVVITGIGTVCALGAGADALWEGLVEGRSGIRPVSAFDPSGFRSRLAGDVPEFSARKFVPKHYRKAVKVMARDTEIAVGAALLAARDASLVTRADGDDAEQTYDGERVGCQIGAGLIASETDELVPALASAKSAEGAFSDRLWGGVAESGGDGGMDNLPPLWLLKYLPNMLACHVTIIHGCEGPSNTITCGEASGLLSIGESLRVIQRGAADACFTGGAESKLNLMGMMRLDLAGQLAEASEGDEGVVRPFNPDATGTLVGEGGGVLILENETSAAARGASVAARVEGFGAAHGEPPFGVMDMGRPGSEVNEGLRYAIENALDDAGVGPESIDAIVPAGLGVPWADRAEAGALRAVFGERLATIPLVTLAPSIGACVAGHGGLQAAVGAMCLRAQRLPARSHGGGGVAGLDCGPSESRACDLHRVLVCTPAVSGQNAALVLGAPGSGDQR